MHCRFVLFAFLFALAHQPIWALRETSYIGKLLFSKEIKKQLPVIPIYYKGRIYYASSSEETPHCATFEFSGSPHMNTLYILFTASPPLPKNVEEQHLQLSTKSPHKLFKLTRKKSQINGEFQYSWNISCLNPEDEPSILPDATMIILINPAVIEKIESNHWPEGMPVRLPTICFKNNINQEKLLALITEMHFGLIDLKNCHRNREEMKICKGTQCIISMPQSSLL